MQQHKKCLKKVPLKYISNFWKILEIPLINFEINLILTWSKNCVAASNTADTKTYVPVVTLSTQDNTKLLQQLKSGFNRTVKFN